MQRLVEDASKMTDVQKELNLTVEDGNLSFGNIVNAISVMQKNMGLAGATANEAATTISGSLGMLKASWQNVITALADDNSTADNLLISYIKDLAESAGIAMDNLLPAVEQALIGVSTLIDRLFPKIMGRLPAIIEETVPKVTESVVKIVESLISGITKNQDSLFKTALSVAMTLANGILDALPQIFELGLSLIITLATGIAENLDALIPSLMETVLKIVEILTNQENLSKLLDAALALIVELAFGLTEAIPQLVDAVYDIIDSLYVFLLDPENLAKIINAALRIVIALGGGLIAAIPRMLTANGQLIKKLIDNFKETDWGKVGENIIDELLDGLKKAWETIKTWFTNAWNSLFSNRSVDISANVGGSGVDGSHAGGLDYVPFDGYVAELHRGEQVLTAEEAKDYKRGGKSVSVVQNIYSQAKTAADLMQEARYQQERAVLFGV